MAASRKLSSMLLAICLSLFALTIFCSIVPPSAFITSVHVRLDSGDLRYTYLFLFPSYQKLPGPERSNLIAVAKTSPKLPPEWVWINFEFAHNPQLICRDFYHLAAVWAPVDPHIARFLMEDHADFIRTSHWQSGLPRSCALDFTISHAGTVNSDWKNDPAVQDYCRSHGYTP